MDKTKKISIIGAGPVGAYSAYLLSDHYDVSIYEEHKTVGNPVQCTGIVTPRINEVIKIPHELIVNRIKYARINSPDGNSVKIKIDDIILDRGAFDRHVFEKAVEKGAKAHLNTRFVDYDVKTGNVKFKSDDKEFTKHTDILIGADGAASRVRSHVTKRKVEFYIGKQATVEGNFEREIFDVYFNVDGFFTWVVPENESIARIGYGYKKFDKRYDDFVKSYGKILGYQAGPIPMFNPMLRTQRGNVYIAGDAASQIKSTTGGGIIQGMLGAKALSESIIKNKNYEIEWRKKLFKELYIHEKIRNKLDRFSAKDYNELVGILSKEKIRHTLEKTNRDNFSKVLIQLMKEPKLFKYAFK